MKASISTTGNRAKAKHATSKPTKPASTRTTKKASPGITQDQLHQLIAEEAYLRAERRGFANGNALDDWLAAEQSITHRLTQGLEQQNKS